MQFVFLKSYQFSTIFSRQMIMRLLFAGIFFCMCMIEGVVEAQTAQPLFYIERTLNANIVRYDAQVNNNGALDQKDPVIAYWLLNAEDGRRKSLGIMDRKMAYGISVKQGQTKGEYILTIVSFKERPIRVYVVDGIARAEMNINGSPALLEKVFVKTTGALSRPQFIEFYGKDPVTGEEKVEKVNTD